MTLVEILDKAEKIANYAACATMLAAGVIGLCYLFKPELAYFKNKIKDYIKEKYQ